MGTDQDLEPLLAIRQNQLSLVFNESSSIDTKALAAIGVVIAVLIYVGQASLHIHHWWQGSLMFGGYILSLISGVLCTWPWPYSGAGINPKHQPEYLEMDRESLVLQLLADTDLAIARNQKLNLMRWRLALLSFVLLAGATGVLFAIL